MDIFSKIVDVFDSQTGLARELGIDPQVISNWKRRGKIPAERCRVIAEASGGKIALHELRPDLYPAA